MIFGTRIKVGSLLIVFFAIIPQAKAVTLLVNQVSPFLDYGVGLDHWTTMTADLNAAFGEANITVSSSLLTDLPTLLSYDRLWITTRQIGDPGLSTTEKANIAAFLSTGRRAVLLGENNSWSAWNSSILSVVGGTYAGGETYDSLTPVLVHPLTEGIGEIVTARDGLTIGGTPLFNENIADLWGLQQNAFTMLSVDTIDNFFGAVQGNSRFATNLAGWLAVPEPSTLALLTLGGVIASLRNDANHSHTNALGAVGDVFIDIVSCCFQGV